jgi:hypothetical protein
MIDIKPRLQPEDFEFWFSVRGFSNYENYCSETKEKISTDPRFAFKYAEKFGPLPEDCESVFLKSPEYAYNYSYWIKNKRLSPKLEKVFSRCPKWAYVYAKKIIKGRLPKNIEKAFLKSPEYALQYARLTGRLQEDLEFVLEDCELALRYAREIIKKGFSVKMHNALFLKFSFEKNHDYQRLYLEQYFQEFPQPGE